MKHSLESLIHPYSKPEFLVHYESSKPFAVHDSGESIRELLKLPFLKSLEALLASWPNKIDAYLPGIADEANSIEIGAQDAPAHYAEGAGLLFSNVNTISPVLGEWLGSVQDELGLSSLTHARNLVYAIPEGKGTSPHFDQNINFVLQLLGNKTWWVAPNHHVDSPMTRHTIGLPVDPELGSYAGRPMPDQFPGGAAEFVLKPGSLLFVPRGAWHQTLARTDSLSLTFTYSAPTWIDLVTAALRGRLAQSAEWRKTADFVRDEDRVDEATKKLDALLSELARDVPYWNAADILEATEGYAGRSEGS